jgi:XisI protein
MDNTLKYQKIITTLLESYAKDWSNGRELDFDVVFDTVRHHYQLICLGWIGDDYVHHIPIHLEIRQGKIWIQKNTTEEYIAETLVEKGILKHDIVLGLQPPEYRKYTEYAIA